jgi:hypothetical protein
MTRTDAWQLHNIFERRAEVHASQCVIPDPRRDEGAAPTVCVTCTDQYHFLRGLSMGLDMLNPGHDDGYRSERLFWGDDEPGFWQGTDVRRDNE